MQELRDLVDERVGESATLATFESRYLNYEDDELNGNGEDTEDERDARSFSSSESSVVAEVPAVPAPKRLTLRLSAGSSSSSSALAPAPALASAPALAPIEFGPESLLPYGNLSSMLEEIGLLQQEDSENKWDFGGAGESDQAGDFLEDSSRPCYKSMTEKEKMAWYDVNGDALYKVPTDKNFRDLYQSGKRGRTPEWRMDFTKW